MSSRTITLLLTTKKLVSVIRFMGTRIRVVPEQHIGAHQRALIPSLFNSRIACRHFQIEVGARVYAHACARSDLTGIRESPDGAGP